jgi:hypothetical protein
MRVTYTAGPEDVTTLARLLLERHRGRVALRYTEDGGIEAEVELPATPSGSIHEALESAAEVRSAA